MNEKAHSMTQTFDFLFSESSLSALASFPFFFVGLATSELFVAAALSATDCRFPESSTISMSPADISCIEGVGLIALSGTSGGLVEVVDVSAGFAVNELCKEVDSIG